MQTKVSRDVHPFPLVVSFAGCAFVAALIAGTLGYLSIGMGVLTNCTTVYNCNETTCSPCLGAAAWLDAGAVGQAVIAAMALGVTLLSLLQHRGRRFQERISQRRLMIGGLLLLVGVVAWGALSTVASLASF